MLLKLTDQVTDTTEKNFLTEAMNCYKIQANRAAIILSWNLTLWHLKKYVFETGTKLDDFNKAFSKVSSKDFTKITIIDDLDGLKEFKFVELAESAGIISKDVKKLLIEKLNIRNTSAHPSDIIVSGHKATEFISDLIKNVILKY